MLSGLGDLLRGIRMVFARPKVAGLGFVPPIVSSVLLVGMFFGLKRLLDDAARGRGPLAGLGAQGWAPVLWFAFEFAALAIGVLVAVLVFSSLTLAIGAPVYEAISGRIDRSVSVVPDAAAPERVHQLVGRVIGQVTVTLLMSVAGAVACFLLGALPVVGVVLGAIASSVFGGWMMARELTGPALERRGMLRLAERAEVLRTRPVTVLAFGVPAFWLLAIPFVSVVFFPGAIAGGTLLVRRLLGEPTRPAEADANVSAG